jgi:fructose-bisphosphate aldolase class 1
MWSSALRRPSRPWSRQRGWQPQVVPFLKVDKGPDRRGRRVQCVMLKLTLPELDAFYADLVTHPNVVRVAALSGGYAARRPTPVLVITTV